MRDISLSYEDGSVLTDADAILQAYEIMLFTSPCEFSAAPDFGIGLEDYIGEVLNARNAAELRNFIIAKTRDYFPEIQILNLQVIKKDISTIAVQIDILVVPYGQRRTINKEIKNE